MNNIQELRKIIADSKEGQNEVYILDGVPYYSTARTSPYRSLADIRTIVEQAEENEALKDRVAELEQDKNYYQDFLEVNTDCESTTELVGKYKKQAQKIAVLEQVLSKPCRACESIRKLDEALGINEQAEQSKSAINLELKQNLGNWKGGAE